MNYLKEENVSNSARTVLIYTTNYSLTEATTKGNREILTVYMCVAGAFEIEQ
jgi:hypothetical protein